MSEFTRIVKWTPAFDKRDADPKKNYGIHGMEVRFVLRGPKGATQFVLYTNWQLKHVEDEHNRRGCRDEIAHRITRPLPADLGRHSLTPRYAHETTMGPCEFLDGADCYYDGTSLGAERVYWRFVAEGEEAVWQELESAYRDWLDAPAERSEAAS